jgi:hypothetical protein
MTGNPLRAPTSREPGDAEKTIGATINVVESIGDTPACKNPSRAVRAGFAPPIGNQPRIVGIFGGCSM